MLNLLLNVFFLDADQLLLPDVILTSYCNFVVFYDFNSFHVIFKKSYYLNLILRLYVFLIKITNEYGCWFTLKRQRSKDVGKRIDISQIFYKHRHNCISINCWFFSNVMFLFNVLFIFLFFDVGARFILAEYNVN